MIDQHSQYKAEFEAIFNSITDAIVFADRSRQIVSVNPSFTLMFGFQPAEVLGRSTQLLYANPEDFFKHGKIRFNEHASIAKPSFETEYRRKNGEIFFGEALGSHVKSDNGELIGFLAVIRDISDRIEAEKILQDRIHEYEITQNLLKESEERFRALHDATFGGVIIHDNGLILDCNQALSDMTGYTNKELVGMNGLKLIAPDSLGLVLENIKCGYAGRYEVEGVRKNGCRYPLSIKGKNVTYKGRDVRVIEFRDITREKQAEKTLRESEERFRHTFITNPDPVILAKLEDGAIVDVNKAFEAVTGILRHEAIGHNSEELGLWKDNSLRGPFREKLQAHGEVTNFEAEFKVKEGQTKTGLLSAKIVTTNELPCILIVIRDISKEKAAELALIEMDQSKSAFISTAAHELRAPLTAIIGYTEILLDPVSNKHISEEVKTDFLQEIFERGETLNRMINDFLDISRIESGLPIPVDLHETTITDVLRKAFEFYQLHEKHRIFQMILPEEPSNPILTIDRHRISQVLENLLSNAVKYSPQGERIILRALQVSEGWEISVEDHGIGMSQDQLDRFFDKFYRADHTDSKVQGLGLGMSIVKHIVEAHGGHIRAESEEGEGTIVTFFLPFVTD